ncbi:MAG: hypothetical protein H0X33_14580 [Taibaiella sp.]|nr:hypothetical protein [Taibaiella sp.]
MTLSEHQERLALEIAHALEDMDSLQSHRKMVATYSEDYLRTKLTKALSMPQTQIRVSRGALYTSLVQGYGKRTRS